MCDLSREKIARAERGRCARAAAFTLAVAIAFALLSSGCGGGGNSQSSPMPNAAEASLSATSLTFTNQPIGSRSMPQAVTLTNSGSVPLTVSTISLTGTNSGDFAQTNSCGASLAAGANCMISVTFTPTAAGTRTGAVSINDNASNSPQTVGLTGTSTSPPTEASLSVTSLTFTNQPIGTSSVPQAVTLTNSGSAPLTVSTISFTGTNSGDFAQTNSCGASLVAGANCMISVTFTPTAAGTRTGAVSINDNASNSPQTVGLTGTGTSPPTPDPLGTATASTTACPSGSSVPGNCYNLTVSCPGVSDITPLLKVTTPSASSIGTIIMIEGGGGDLLYETKFVNGPRMINSLVQAGFTTVQIAFMGASVGWLTGPGGPRRLACRFATASRWIYDNIHQQSATNGFCATGQSGGSGAIAYALAHYGLASIFNMVEETGGPPFSRIDYGCYCTQPPIQTPCAGLLGFCYANLSATILDPSYGSNICSSSQNSTDTTNATLFINDSLLAADAVLAYPTTDMHFVFGDQDTSSAPPQGILFESAVTTKKTVDCVANTGHAVPDTTEGAIKIFDDLRTYCHVQ